MPVFNGAGVVSSAIRSILAQTYEEWFLHVVDDGSVDNIVEVVEGFDDQRISLVVGDQNRGIAESLNRGVGSSRGALIARMDADDISFPDRLEAQVKFLLANPSVDALATAVLAHSADGTALGIPAFREDHDDICRRPWRGFPMVHPTWMGRRNWFEEYPYRSSVNGAEDQDMLYRSHRTSRFACLPDVLLGYRENRNARKMYAGRTAFLKAVIGEAARERRWGVAAMAVGTQAPRYAGDFLNLKLGSKRFRNRLTPADPSLLDQWQRIWQSANSR